MEKFSRTKRVFSRFYILCENFSKIGPTIKKIPNFQTTFSRLAFLCLGGGDNFLFVVRSF